MLKHLKSHPVLESRENLVSPTLSPITTYFETEKGSKYLLSQKGETKRWKSSHANTGGEDTGLKEWFSHSMFVPPGEIDSMLAYEHLLDKGYKISISGAGGGKRVWVIFKEGTWQPATYGDAYPVYSRRNPEMAGKPLGFTPSATPIVGHMAVEYKQEPDGRIRSFHPGSAVSKVLPISQADPRDLAHFGIRSQS